MRRVLLAWVLLLNYLLVVGAGLRVGRPEAPAFSAARPYVHSKECQQQHYLQLDCFEQCNGNQHEIKVKLPAETALHFLAQLKGLDVHCGFATWPVAIGAAAQWPGTARPAGVQLPAMLRAGFGGCDYPPPRRA
jgi:hypothetical protein